MFDVHEGDCNLHRNLYDLNMSLLNGSEHLSITEAAKRGISGLIADVAHHSILLEKRGTAQALILSMDQVAEFNEVAEDLRDLALVLSRSATDNGIRTSFDDVLLAFDLSREDLKTIRDTEESESRSS